MIEIRTVAPPQGGEAVEIPRVDTSAEKAALAESRCSVLWKKGDMIVIRPVPRPARRRGAPPARPRPPRVGRRERPGRLQRRPAVDRAQPAREAPLPPRRQGRVRDGWEHLPSAQHARRRDEVSRIGRVVEEKDPRTGEVRRIRLYFGRIEGEKVWIDSRPTPDGRRVPFGTSRQAAEEALKDLRGDILHSGKPIAQILALWRPGADPAALVENRVAEWLAHLNRLVAQRQRSPNTVREYERYARPDGPFSYFYGWAVEEIRAKHIREWHAWLGEQVSPRTGRAISPTTQKHISDAFRAFFNFLVADEVLERAPRFPAIQVPRYVPTTITWEQLGAILEEIPWKRRGAFLVAASEALRLSEIRAIDLDDYRDGRLFVGRSIQGPRLNAPIVDWTKNNSAEWRELWFTPLIEWVEWRLEQATPERRLRGEVAMFWNPTARNVAKRWAPNALERQWHQAREAAGVPFISFQEGTRHSLLTALGEQLPERMLRAFSRHQDARSLDRYSKPRPSPKAIVLALPRQSAEDPGS